MRRAVPSLLALCLAGTAIPATAEAKESPAQSAQAVELPEGVELIERVDPDPTKVAIPYQKYRLANGLTVLLLEDHSDPLAYINVTYHVGSARETPGRSGFAHLFEHMMFQGSENVGENEHFKIVTAAGGFLNGSTFEDRTTYYQTVPANYLERVLWLEADRMGFLLPAITERTFENQRETVKNERSEIFDNAPYGLMEERIGQALYPAGHPYNWPTVGYMRDIHRAELPELKTFFHKWYGPNNATLMIGGDVDPAQTLRWVVKYFGPIPAGPAIEPLPKTPVTLSEDRYITLEDNVPQAKLRIDYPTVHMYHPDEPALDLLQVAMTSGKSSLLEQNLVDTGLAVRASAYHSCLELACTFSIAATPKSGVTLAQLKAAIDDSFRQFEREGIDEQSIRKNAETMRARRLYGLQSVASRAVTLLNYEMMLGNPDYIQADLERYAAVTPERVNEVYEQYIKGGHAVHLSVVRRGKADEPIAPQNWSPPPPTADPAQTTAQGSEENQSAVAMRTPQDDFDRSVPPPPGPAVIPTMPELWHATLPNGVRVIGTVNSEAPVTNMWVRFGAGAMDQPLDELGVATVTDAIMEESTTLSSAETLAARLRDIGSTVSFSVGERGSTMSVQALSDKLPETIAIAREKLLHPKFDPAEFARIREKVRSSAEGRLNDPGTMVSIASEQALLGPDNPLSYPSTGMPDTLAELTVDETRAFYEDRLLPSLSNIVVVSSLGKEEVLAQLAPFGALSRNAVQRAGQPASVSVPARTLYLVDKPGAAQSQIRVVADGPAFDAFGDYMKSDIVNYPFGGGFSSRINLNLREDKGYTYGARSSFSANENYGTFTLDTGVRTDVTGAALREIMNELRRYSSEGMTPEELEFTRSSQSQVEALAYEGAAQKAAVMMRIVDYDLPEDYRATQLQMLETVELDELNTLAARLMRPDEMTVVIVGDSDAVRPQLAGLNFNVVDVTAFLEPVVTDGERASVE